MGENHLFFFKADDVALLFSFAVDSAFGSVSGRTENGDLAFQNGLVIVESPSANILVTIAFIIILFRTGVDILFAVCVEFHDVITFVTASFVQKGIDVSDTICAITLGASECAQSPTFFNGKEFGSGGILLAGSEHEGDRKSHCDDA